MSKTTHSIKCPAYLSPSMEEEGIEPGECDCKRRPKPKNGWLVASLALSQYMFCNSEDDLARQVDRMYHELDKNPDLPIYPGQAIQVYELGERVSVMIEPKVAEIRLEEEKK